MVRRRAIALLTLAAFVGASVGLAVPEFGAGRVTAGDEDFPCRGHACGCVDAESCRTNCCCGLVSQPSPPKEIIASCCSSKSSECDSPQVEVAAVPPEAGLILRALSCKGISLLVISLGVVLQSSDVIALDPPQTTSRLALPQNDVAVGFSLEPPDSPPRV